MRKFKPVILVFCLAALMYGLSYIPTLYWAHGEFTQSLVRDISYFLLGCGILMIIILLVHKRK